MPRVTTDGGGGQAAWTALYKDREYARYLLHHAVREGTRVHHETLANLSALPPRPG